LGQGVGIAADGKDLGAAGDQLQGDFPANTAGGAGNKDALVAEVECNGEPLWELVCLLPNLGLCSLNSFAGCA
jgi:hypothetical protein